MKDWSKFAVVLFSIAILSSSCYVSNTTETAVGDLDIQESKRDAAYQVAQMLNDAGFRTLLAQRFEQGATSVMLTELLAEHRKTAHYVAGHIDHAALRLQRLDQRIRKAKHIDRYASDLLEVRLIKPDNAPSTIDWNRIPVAFTPAGDETQWTEIEAFDAAGTPLVLDAHVQPDDAVLVAGINASADLRAGIAYINDELTKYGLQAPVSVRNKNAPTETSKLDYIRLNDDKEPWISGAAEIFALVSGVHFDHNQVEIQAVDLPYLDHDHTSYTPNQILIFWETYRFAAANVQLYEHDDNTNYQDLVLTIVAAVEQILDLTAPEYAIIAQIASAIIQAMPDEWFSNDDDYVDSFYTLEKDTTYTGHLGAAQNAVITLVPYTLQGN